ncbi:MAG: tRNA-intron lyase [Candidatus Aenigmarchaeota archaeon]|nr:tRNA-intron lyase [Candidatus Aenigmarchaeota archaeon]
MLEGELLEQRVIIWDKEAFSELEESGYGKVLEDRLELTLVEAMFLFNKGKLAVFVKEENEKKKLSKEELYEYCVKNERNFHARLVVYTDLRDRGFLVKTGFKFGTDFRIYERGVKLKKGPKAAFEHTKFVAHAIPEEFSCSFPELSRAVRLAQNIRSEMIWAVVDGESCVTYYGIKRLTL